MNAQIPRDHHYLPVFYQQPWTVGGRVTRYRWANGRIVTSHPGPTGTGFEPDLYALEGVEPHHRAMIETEFFMPVDNFAAPILAKLLAGGLNGLTHEERVHWARFVMSMQSRNPFALSEMERFADMSLRSTLAVDDAAFNALRKPGDPENIYDWTLKHHPHVITEFHKRILPTVIDHEDLGTYILGMVWATIDVASANHRLLTSDRPFLHTLGWKDPHTTLLFPLSPDLLFIATNDQARAAWLASRPPNQIVKASNDQIVRAAMDFVIGHDDSQKTFVERRLRKPDQQPIPGMLGAGRPGCPGGPAL